MARDTCHECLGKISHSGWKKVTQVKRKEQLLPTESCYACGMDSPQWELLFEEEVKEVTQTEIVKGILATLSMANEKRCIVQFSQKDEWHNTTMPPMVFGVVNIKYDKLMLKNIVESLTENK